MPPIDPRRPTPGLPRPPAAQPGLLQDDLPANTSAIYRPGQQTQYRGWTAPAPTTTPEGLSMQRTGPEPDIAGGMARGRAQAEGLGQPSATGNPMRDMLWHQSRAAASLAHLSPYHAAQSQRYAQLYNQTLSAEADQTTAQAHLAQVQHATRRPGLDQIMRDPASAWALGYEKGGPDVAQEHAEQARFYQSQMPGYAPQGPAGANAAQEAAGQPAHMDPSLARTTIQNKYGYLSHLLARDAKGAPAHDLPDVFAQLQQMHPTGWDQPGSELSQALTAQIPGLYGADLPQQLQVPMDPSNVQVAGHKMPAWLMHIGMANPLVGMMRSDVNVGVNPTNEYHRRASAANWWNAINGQPQTYR